MAPCARHVENIGFEDSDEEFAPPPPRVDWEAVRSPPSFAARRADAPTPEPPVPGVPKELRRPQKGRKTGAQRLYREWLVRSGHYNDPRIDRNPYKPYKDQEASQQAIRTLLKRYDRAKRKRAQKEAPATKPPERRAPEPDALPAPQLVDAYGNDVPYPMERLEEVYRIRDRRLRACRGWR